MYHLPILLFLLMSLAPVPEPETVRADLNELSELFLVKLQKGESTTAVRNTLRSLSLQELETGLQDDREKLAFWINIYNAYIQYLLKNEPGLYKDRGEFFKKDQIPIAGRNISFEKIEHGIIRKSQWPYGLGYIRKWFPNRFERKLRIDSRDYRIHFALNCGANDCPPVAIYTPGRLNSQLDKGTEAYLKQFTSYDKDENEVSITPLFQWFRGDFSPPGILGVLKRHGIIPAVSDPEIEFRNYDWSLDLDNYVEL